MMKKRLYRIAALLASLAVLASCSNSTAVTDEEEEELEEQTLTVEDEEYFKKTTDEIISTREYSKKRLSELGFIFPDSMSNFIFASHSSVPAKEIFGRLKECGIYVRYWDKPRVNNHLRITIGTREKMDKVFDKLAEIVG